MINHVQFPALGLEFEINRVAFTVFGVDVFWYGILLTGGFLTASVVCFQLIKKFNINSDHFTDVLMIGAIGGIICARLYYVAFGPIEYETFFDMMNIRDGGIGIYGGLIGGFSFGWLACRWRKIDFLNAADCVATVGMLGQAIGRWGNFVNQEAFGTNTDSVFGMISEATTKYLTRVAPSLARNGIIVDPNMPVHPTFLYESVWCLIGFILLMLYFNRRKFKGEMLCLYAVWYGVGRYFIEGLRTDSLVTGSGMRTSQFIAVVTVTAGIAVIVYNYNKLRKTGEKIHG